MDGISLDIPRLNPHKWGHNPIYKYPIITPQLNVDACQPKQSQLADLRKNLGFYQLKDDVILIWSQSLNGIGVQRRLSWAVL